MVPGVGLVEHNRESAAGRDARIVSPYGPETPHAAFWPKGWTTLTKTIQHLEQQRQKINLRFRFTAIHDGAGRI